MSKSKIEWTDRTWNPVTGCTKVSQGCKNCYAERMYERFNGKGTFKNITCHTNRLRQPLSWKKPSMVFVNSMSDLFHEDVPFEFINSVFSVMSDVNIHTYQILTKRPQRMLEFYEWKADQFSIPWQPSSNVWIGVSIEDQKAADERIPLLLKLPAAIRFLSCEPLLADVNLKPWIKITNKVDSIEIHTPFHWVIAGGESGPKARPMHPDWARSLRDQCNAASVPFFFKQWGEWLPFEETAQAPFYRRSSDNEEFDGHVLNFIDLETNEAGKWQGKRWRGFDGSNCSYLKTGKKNAGCLLDGKEYKYFPIKK